MGVIQIGKTKIPPAYFKMIEHELYNYDETKEMIGRLKEEIIETPPLPICEQDGSQRSGTSDKVFQKTYQIYTNSFIAHMEKTVRAIDRALVQLGEMHSEIFELKYRKGKHYTQVSEEMSVSQETYYIKRRELVYAVAVNMGVVNP